MVRAPEFDGVSLPPGEVAPELEGAQAGEDVMVEPAAQAAGVVAADFERLAHPVSRAAFALDAGDGRLHPVADSRILRHDASLKYSDLRLSVHGSTLEQDKRFPYFAYFML